MRIAGHILRPSTLQERRLLLSLGTPWLRLPRKHGGKPINPFAIARMVRRMARGGEGDLTLLRALAVRSKKADAALIPPELPGPGLDTPTPRTGDDDAVAA